MLKICSKLRQKNVMSLKLLLGKVSGSFLMLTVVQWFPVLPGADSFL